MNKIKKPIILGAIVLFLIIMCLCIFWPKQQAITDLEARNIYLKAAMSDFNGIVLRCLRTQEITSGNNTISDQSNYTIAIEQGDAGRNRIQLQETLVSGKHSAEISEIYYNGTVYTTVNESQFSCKMKQTQYLDRLIPAVLLTPNNYESISGIKTRRGYELTFSKGLAPESWCCDADVTFVSSSGSAFVQRDGTLSNSTYCITYTIGGAHYSLKYQCEITGEKANISIPENLDNYTEISYLDGLRLLEKASGYLTQLENISSSSKDITYFQAFGDRRTQEIELSSRVADTWTAKIQNTVTFTNDGRLGADSVQKETRLFENGEYTLTGADGSAIAYRDITEEDMRIYCQNLLVNTVVLPQHIAGCNAELKDGVLKITYSANENFGVQICNTAYQVLYPQSDLLSPKNNKIKTVYGYLELDAATGIPLSSGIYYDSIYTVDSIGYQLLFQADQIYTLLNSKEA